MKRRTVIFCGFLFAFFLLKAQTNLTEAVDFTATNAKGDTINLFQILDGGQYVLIDFFFTDCAPCQNEVPHVVQNYSRYGCNQHNVFFMEISPSDSDEECIEWENRYGVQYPTIGRDGGGNSICSQYGVSFYPTVVLIAPNRQIIRQDIYPSSYIPTNFSAVGINEATCTSTIIDKPIIKNSIAIYPNPTSDFITITYNDMITEGAKIILFDITGKQLLTQPLSSMNNINISHLADGVYWVRIGDETRKIVKN